MIDINYIFKYNIELLYLIKIIINKYYIIKTKCANSQFKF